MGFVGNLVLFVAVKEFCKPIKNNDKVVAMVMVAPFFDSRCRSTAGHGHVHCPGMSWAGPLSPSKLPLHVCGSGPHLTHGSLGARDPSPRPKRHLDMSSRFCGADGRYKQIDRPTDHTGTPSIAISGI